MIRCARAKSSLCYPEVFHRFCGYLDAYEKFFSFVSDDAACALSSGRRMNFTPPSKKVLERGAETGLTIFVTRRLVGALVVAPADHSGKFAEKMPSQRRIR
jgi:beta-lactamase superfamily II metal-dependent hydrolase